MHAEEIKSEDYEVYVNQIVNSFSKDMEKEYNLICIGDGGRMPYDVEEISVKFLAFRKVSIEEARKLEVNCTERLLKAINSNDKIRPFLREYPFKANRAKISISFRNKNNTYHCDGGVDLVFHAKNKIYYRSEDPSTEQFFSLAEEPYEEALKIVQQNTKSP